MAKRVLQADGKYCFTENCSIHDRRSLPAVGVASVRDDAHRTTRDAVESNIVKTLKSSKSLYKTKLDLNEAAAQIVEKLYNSRGITMDSAGNAAKDVLYGEKGLNDSYNWEKLRMLGNHIQVDVMLSHSVEQGDRVVTKTGDIGTVVEAASFNSRLRVKSDSPTGPSFQWYNREDLDKINDPANTSRLARERIVFAAPDATLEPEVVSSLLRQESNPGTYNAQALRNFSPEERDVITSELQEIADRWDKAGVSRRITKGYVNKFLQQEYDAQRPWLSREEYRLVRGGLANLLAYTNAGSKVLAKV